MNLQASTTMIPAELDTYIASVTDRSDELMKRLRVMFTNGYGISIIQGEYAYGDSEQPFEIALVDLDGDMSESLFDEEDQGDTVLGYCDQAKLNHYMQKLAFL